MAVSKAEVLDLADKLQGRVKFYHVGDPHRKLLETTFGTLRTIADTTKIPNLTDRGSRHLSRHLKWHTSRHLPG